MHACVISGKSLETVVHPLATAMLLVGLDKRCRPVLKDCPRVKDAQPPFIEFSTNHLPIVTSINNMCMPPCKEGHK